MSTPVNIIIDNKTVLDDVVSCEIQQREGQFCRTVSLQFSSQTFWALCDPATNFGELRIKVVIGNITYEFLAEERDSNVSTSGVAFSVWGRSKQALLARPYSENINDTDDTSHPWQTGNTTASAIISHIVTNYCPYSVTVTWNVDDFAVYQDTFSVSNQAPIDIISSLANVVGAELKANADGSLSIEEYSVEEGTSLASYTDLDDIVQLSESIDYPSGYNAVTVYGYDSGAAAGGDISVLDETVDPTNCPDEEHHVKVFYHHPTLAPLCSFLAGSYGDRGSGTESVTETVTLIWGKGNTSYPNLQGSTEVTGDTAIPITTTSVTYTARYKRFYLKASSVGSYTAMFYFSDQSDYSTYSFTVSDCSDIGAISEACSEIVLRWSDDSTKSPGDRVKIKVYNAGLDVASIYSAGGAAVTLFAGNRIESVTESITFTNGEARLSYPLDSNLTITYDNQAAGSPDPIITVRRRDIIVNEFIDNTEFYKVYATVTYLTEYDEYKTTIPGSYGNDYFDVWFEFTGCDDVKSVAASIREAEEEAEEAAEAAEGGEGGGVTTDDPAPYELEAIDYCSDGTVEGVAVTLNGNYMGLTDSNGIISLGNLTPGVTYRLKLVKEGYQDSDLDNLNNDSFTIPRS